MFNAYLHTTHLEAENAELQKRIQQIERERDALVKDLKEAHRPCDSCKHNNDFTVGCAGRCAGYGECEIINSCVCFGCTDSNSHWEWRGVKED